MTKDNLDPSLQYCKIVKKPWGQEIWFACTDKYVGKILTVVQGSRLSLQYHEVKDETLMVLNGTAKITVDDCIVMATSETGSVRVVPNCRHRIEAITDVTIVEVSTPEVTDVVRIEDDYGRDAKGN